MPYLPAETISIFQFTCIDFGGEKKTKVSSGYVKGFRRVMCVKTLARWIGGNLSFDKSRVGPAARVHESISVPPNPGARATDPGMTHIFLNYPASLASLDLIPTFVEVSAVDIQLVIVVEIEVARWGVTERKK